MEAPSRQKATCNVLEQLSTMQSHQQSCSFGRRRGEKKGGKSFHLLRGKLRNCEDFYRHGMLLYFQELLSANDHIQYAHPSLGDAKVPRTPPVCLGVCLYTTNSELTHLTHSFLPTADHKDLKGVWKNMAVNKV